MTRSALRRIAIVGAGLGGLTAALALLRRGFEVRVYEQAAELTEVGAGLQLSANATRVLFELGLEQAGLRVHLNLVERSSLAIAETAARRIRLVHRLALAPFSGPCYIRRSRPSAVCAGGRSLPALCVLALGV